MDREISGIFIATNKGSRCFEDLTEEEQDLWLSKLNIGDLKRLSKKLAGIIRILGDEMDIHVVRD
jgi:hypothetical protein